jgi:hypothetical protein
VAACRAAVTEERRGIDIRKRGSTIHPHVTAIKLNVGGVELTGTLDGSPIAQRVVKLLPFESTGETWGREVYFPVDLAAENHQATSEVKAGDIAFWPDGPDLCIFFGPTPKSSGEAPVVASPVTVIGSCRFSPEDFDRIERRRNGIVVRIEPGQ